MVPLATGAVPFSELLSQPLSLDPQPETVGELATSNATESGTMICDIPPKPPTQEETIETLLESNKEGLSTEQHQQLWDLLYAFRSICVDFRPVNEITVKDSYPPP